MTVWDSLAEGWSCFWDMLWEPLPVLVGFFGAVFVFDVLGDLLLTGLKSLWHLYRP